MNRLPDIGDTYTCELCKGTFKATVSKQDCIAEQEILSGEEHDPATTKVICDDCHKEVLRWWNREGKYLKGAM